MLPVVLTAVLSPDDLTEVKSVLDTARWLNVEDDSVRRNIKQINLPPLHWLHFRLRHRVAGALGLTGEDVMPTTIFGVRYEPDSELRWHRDRDFCEWTISVTIDDGGVPWPLKLKPRDYPGNIMALEVPVGDAVLYHRLDFHGRKTRPASEPPYTTMLFHYVPSSFRGSYL